MKDYEKWFKKADSDLLNIQNNFSAKNISVDTCCFHAQQAAEKYLKAYLVAHRIEFPKTHDLMELNKLCSQKNEIYNEIKKLCISLTDYGIAPRYPDTFDDLTTEDAKLAYENALVIKEFILQHFFE